MTRRSHRPRRRAVALVTGAGRLELRLFPWAAAPGALTLGITFCGLCGTDVSSFWSTTCTARPLAGTSGCSPDAASAERWTGRPGQVTVVEPE